MSHGSIPYDNMTLPLVSPDGQFVATQTGVSPTWETILAQPDATVPHASRIEIYQISQAPNTSPQLIATISEPVLLGRACDQSGFLIESPREDGSRWIGHAAWESAEIRWLVDDQSVNAFATLGPSGQLAWSSKTPDANHFSLSVRRGIRTFTIPAQGRDWLMPVYSGVGDSLFALTLSNGFLDAVYGSATDTRAFQQSKQHLTIAQNASPWTAYQTLAAAVSVIDGSVPEHEQLAFFHIPRSRAAIWRPLTGSRRNLTFLDERTYMVLPVDNNRALAVTDRSLILQNVGNVRDKADLLAGMLIPRPTQLRKIPYLLLETAENRIALTSLALLSPDEEDIQ